MFVLFLLITLIVSIYSNYTVQFHLKANKVYCIGFKSSSVIVNNQQYKELNLSVLICLCDLS